MPQVWDWPHQIGRLQPHVLPLRCPDVLPLSRVHQWLRPLLPAPSLPRSPLPGVFPMLSLDRPHCKWTHGCLSLCRGQVSILWHNKKSSYTCLVHCDPWKDRELHADDNARKLEKQLKAALRRAAFPCSLEEKSFNPLGYEILYAIQNIFEHRKVRNVLLTCICVKPAKCWYPNLSEVTLKKKATGLSHLNINKTSPNRNHDHVPDVQKWFSINLLITVLTINS